MIDDAVKQKVRKFLQDEGYGNAVADTLLSDHKAARDEFAKEAMRELIRAQCSGQMLVKMDVEEISQLAYQQADSMLLRKALVH
jgi:hypothetical protein